MLRTIYQDVLMMAAGRGGGGGGRGGSRGGSSSGGSRGGSKTGGSKTGGSKTGGSKTGGSKTGGSKPGGSKPGGSKPAPKPPASKPGGKKGILGSLLDFFKNFSKERNKVVQDKADVKLLGYDSNKVSHIFADKHRMSSLTKEFGSPEAALKEMHKAAQPLAKKPGAYQNGSWVTVRVGNSNVSIKGAVINGTFRISTATMRPF